MQKKLTITLDECVYEGLHRVVGRRRISRFIESLVRPHVVGEGLEAADRQMASEEAREAEAIEWDEATARMLRRKKEIALLGGSKGASG